MAPQTTTLARLAAVIEPGHHRSARDIVVNVTETVTGKTAIVFDVSDAHVVLTLDRAERQSLRELLA